MLQKKISFYGVCQGVIAAVMAVMLLSVTAVSSAQQAPPPVFEAIMYNANLGEIIVVDQSGTELERTLLPSLGSKTISDSIAVSDNGNRIAYVLTDTNAQVKDLMIYDRQQDTIAAQYRIPNSGTGSVSHSLSPFVSTDMRNSPFDQSGQFFAFGYNVGFTNWELIIYDVNNNSVRRRLTNQTATFPSQVNAQSRMPIPRQFDGQYVDFTLQPVASGGAPEYPNFRWDTVMNPNNRLTELDAFRAMNGDFIDGSNQFISAVPDFRLPNVNYQARGPAVQFNALHAATSNTGSTFPFYSDRDLSFSQPRFIQNNLYVTARGQTFPAYASGRWTVIDPTTGQKVGQLGIGDLAPQELLGVRNGYLYSADATDIQQATGYQPSPNAATTALMYVDTTQSVTNGPGQRVWLGNPNEFARLEWVSDTSTGPAAPAASSWNRLSVNTSIEPYTPGADCNTSPDVCTGDELIQPPVDILDPCIPNPALCELQVGIEAEVNTTRGDLANLREFPDAGAENIVAQLPDGEAVRIIEGPREGDQFTWWQIETINGQVGWIVQRVENVPVLIRPQETDDPGINPTTPPPAGGDASLTPGGFARVTDQGDNLNARTEPTVDSPVLAVLQRGDVVNVLDGPVTADGYTWWQVETPEGAAWAAQGTPNENWLQPSAADANDQSRGGLSRETVTTGFAQTDPTRSACWASTLRPNPISVYVGSIGDATIGSLPPDGYLPVLDAINNRYQVQTPPDVFGWLAAERVFLYGECQSITGTPADSAQLPARTNTGNSGQSQTATIQSGRWQHLTTTVEHQCGGQIGAGTTIPVDIQVNSGGERITMTYVNTGANFTLPRTGENTYSGPAFNGDQVQVSLTFTSPTTYVAEEVIEQSSGCIIRNEWEGQKA